MITCSPVTGIGEVTADQDLAGLLSSAVALRDGDILVVTSKVVSKAEGRVATGDRAAMVSQEAERLVARRGPTSIVRTRHGLVMAAAGIDASNTAPGTLVLLPLDPDASARALREGIAEGGGPNVGVLVSDTSGRPWRNGQTDVAIGAAGVEVLDDHAGRDDGYGNLLAVTAPALADEITAAADLVTGKLNRSPAALVRGLDHLVLPAGEHGQGAAALVRPEGQDMFGLGSREAVLQGLLREDARGFGDPAGLDDVVAGLGQVLPGATVRPSAGEDAVEVHPPASTRSDARRLGALEERATTVAYCLGWRRAPLPGSMRAGETGLRFVPAAP